MEWNINGVVYIPWTDVKKRYKVKKSQLKFAVKQKRVATEIIVNPNNPGYNPEFTGYAVGDLEELFPKKERKETIPQLVEIEPRQWF